MTGRRLILLRHGRTAWNHAGRVQGQLEVSLDEEGRRQAAAVGPVLAAYEPSLLVSSDLARTRETTAAVAAATGLEARYDERLREFFFGAREGLTHAEYGQAHPEEFARFRTGDYDATPTSERTAAVCERMSAALNELLSALQPSQTGIAVSHGAAIRVAVGAMLGWDDAQFHTLRGLDNCGWVLLEEHPEVGALRLGAYNRQAPATP